jgi:twitching motility protein PilT
LSEFPLGAEQARALCFLALTDAQKTEFDKNKKIEFSFGIKGIGRFKANISSAEGKVSGAFTILDQS